MIKAFRKEEMDSKKAKSPICEIGALFSSIQNPSSVFVDPHLNQNHLESTILSFISFPDSPLFSNSYSSFDRVLHEFLSSYGDDDSVQDQIIDRTLQRVSLLLESTKRCFRKRLTLHNSISWFLPYDLTVKIFSMLDTKSLMQAAACCTMFNKSTMDPLCYSHIDFATAFEHVDDGVVSSMVHRVGKELRSIKLGSDAPGYFPHLLTTSCLAPLLSSDREINGNLLRSLHIYYIGFMDIDPLCTALSACANLTELKIVGLNFSLEPILELLARKCCLIEHLFLENSSRGTITNSTIEAFVINCPNLTSLTLKGFNLNDAMARILVKGFRKLKYMDLSSAYEIHGRFLRDLGHSCKDSPLETLILCDCSLEEREVLEFLNSLITGNFRFIRYIDVSRNYGLAIDGDGRLLEPNCRFPLEKLEEERPDFKFVAELKEILPSWSPSPFYDNNNDDQYLGCFARQSRLIRGCDAAHGYSFNI